MEISKNEPRERAKWRTSRPWVRSDFENMPTGSRLRNRGQSVHKRVVAWFKKSGRCFPWRSPSATDYERLVTEILLQQTSARNVASQYQAFFSRFPSWESLARTGEDAVSEQLRPLGLWRRRASSLRKLATTICKRDGVLPSSREEIERLPGVGQYIASAVMLFELGLPEPLLDVNMARVLERYFGYRTKADIRYDRFLQGAARACIDGGSPAEANWGLLDLGAMVCRPRNPRCKQCPLKQGCYYRSAVVEKLTGNIDPQGSKFHTVSFP